MVDPLYSCTYSSFLDERSSRMIDTYYDVVTPNNFHGSPNTRSEPRRYTRPKTELDQRIYLQENPRVCSGYGIDGVVFWIEV